MLGGLEHLKIETRLLDEKIANTMGWTVFEHSSVTSILVRKLALKQHCIQSFISKENAGKASVGVAALPGASACKLWQERREQRCWERVTGRGCYTTRQPLHSQDRLKVL